MIGPFIRARSTAGRAVVVAALAFGAFAAPSTLHAETSDDEIKSVEDILQEAVAAKEAAAKAAAEAARDPTQDLIDKYKSGVTPLDEFTDLTEIVMNSKDEELQGYRMKAVRGILDRFSKENVDDPIVAKTRALLTLEIVDLMKARTSDSVGLAIIQEVLEQWYRSKMKEFRFKAADKSRARQKAHMKMRQYLQASSKD